MKRFGIFDCSYQTEYAEIFLKQLRNKQIKEQIKEEEDDDNKEEEEVWEIIKVCEGNKINERFYNYNCIIITGSHCNIRDKEEWYQNVIEFIQYSSKKGSPKIFGGCFGSQIIAYALGGEVDRNPSNTFIIQPERILLTSNFERLLRLIHQNDNNNNNNNNDNSVRYDSLNLIESHGDCVTVLPPDTFLLGYSSSCSNEIFLTGVNDNILGCQSHPEFSSIFALQDCEDILTDDEKRIAQEKFQNFDSNDSIYFMNSILYHFIRS